MPSPVSPETLSALVPPRNGSFCGRFIPGIINWMQERANYWSWVYKSNGDFTVSFITDLCIAVNGTVTPDPTTCPQVAFSAKVLSRHEMLKLTFTGVGMTAGYTWNLYRSTSVSGPWGASITSGTTTGAVISYDDSGLTNDTTYYYRLVVQKAGCPQVIFQTSGTPKLCLAFDFQMTIVQLDDGDGNHSIELSITNVDPDYPMDNSFTYELLVNGAGVFSGNLSAFPITITNEVSPGIGKLFTLNITEKPGCDAVSHSQNVTVVGSRLAAPALFIQDGSLAWTEVPGATAYFIYIMSLSECRNQAGSTLPGVPYPINQWIRIAGTIPTSRTYPITRQVFKSNFILNSIVQPISLYKIYVVAVGFGGIEGYPSNPVEVRKWLGGTGCGN